MDTSFKNKNIVLISPSFFNYHIKIKEKLEELGANVFFIDDRFGNDTISKVILRLKFLKSLAAKKNKEYFNEKLNEIPFQKVDYFFVINPEGLNDPIIKNFKSKYPEAEFILYMWDSFNNKKGTSNIYKLFDKSFSFDKKDAEKYNIRFLPLFYLDEYKNLNNTDVYKLNFIGTAHTDRYYLVKKIANQVGTQKNFFYFFFQSKLLFFYNKLFNKSFKYVQTNDIKYKPLSFENTLKAIGKSEIIIDIHHPLQNGLTIRSIESLGAKKKLITTNSDISNYDFYNEDNILIIDRNDPKINSNFLNSNYIPVDNKIYDKYSIENWLKTIFFNQYL